MSILDLLFRITMSAIIASAILYLIFAQVTVRKLEKIQVTREQMGFEPISGWRIFNVAQALSFPKTFFHRVQRSPLSFLHANAELIYANTNRLDRVLARLFYWTSVGSTMVLILLWLTDLFGLAK